MSKASEQDQAPPMKLMDRTWERVQRKTFFGWTNYHLNKRQLKINSAEEFDMCFEDGIYLHALFEILSETKLGKINAAPKTKPHKLDNLKVPVDFINNFCKEQKIKLAFSSEEIMQGKGILGLIWIIILRYSINDVSEESLSAKEGLLLWCKKVLKPYENVKMANFTSHWQDGLAFTGLIHRHHPDWIEDPRTMDPKNALENLNKVFAIAEAKLGIPRLLDAEDLILVADEKSIMTYVAFYWKAFASSGEALRAAGRIAKAIERKRANERMMADYNKAASDLAEWIAAKDAFFAVHEFGNSYEECEACLGRFKGYRSNEKPPKYSEKASLAVQLNNLQSTMRNQGAAPYTPPENITIDTITVKWQAMVDKEVAYEAALRAALIRKRKVELDLAVFNQKADRLGSWIAEKNSYTSNHAVGSSLYEAEGLLKKHAAFKEEVNAYAPRYVALASLGQSIIAMEPSHTDHVDGRVATAMAEKESLRLASEAKEAQIVENIKRLHALEEQKVEIAKKVEQFALWAEDVNDIIHHPIRCDTVDEVKKLQEDLAQARQMIEHETHEVDAIVSIDAQLGGDSPYSRFSAAEIQAKFSSVKAGADQRQSDLQAEMTRQEQREAYRVAFAQAAENLHSHVEKVLAQIRSLAGSLADQATAIEVIRKEKLANGQLMQGLVSANQHCNDSQINENPHTALGYEQCVAAWDQLDGSIQEKNSFIAREQLAAKGGDISPEQAKEIEDVFKHFDKDKSGNLQFHEFKAALNSLGENIQDDQIVDILSALGAGKDTPLTFEQFQTFMLGRLKDSNTKEEIQKSFQLIAGDNGKIITESQIRALDATHAEYLLAILPKVDGGYDYTAFIDSCYSSS